MIWWVLSSASVVAYLLTKFCLPGLQQLIQQAGFVRPNYLGKMIPVGTGMVFFLCSLPAILVPLAVLGRIGRNELSLRGLLLLLGLAGMSLVGLVDDVFGNRSATGLTGHWRKLIKDLEVTTGSLKALLAGILAVGIVVLDDSLVQSEQVSFLLLGRVVLRVLVIVLFTNFLNLLDLRPGRAGKAYVLAVGLGSAAAWPWAGNPEIGYLWIMLGSLLAYLPKDLRAELMMGDSGANALGFCLGLVSVWVLPDGLLLIVVSVLAIVHLWAEKYSLSKLITSNAVLCYLDNLGRR